jgi:hypothetical protein
MTVAELIEQLREYQPSRVVLMRDSDGDLGKPYPSGIVPLVDPMDASWIGLPQGTLYVQMSLDY